METGKASFDENNQGTSPDLNKSNPSRSGTPQISQPTTTPGPAANDKAAKGSSLDALS